MIKPCDYIIIISQTEKLNVINTQFKGENLSVLWGTWLIYSGFRVPSISMLRNLRVFEGFRASVRVHPAYPVLAGQLRHHAGRPVCLPVGGGEEPRYTAARRLQKPVVTILVRHAWTTRIQQNLTGYQSCSFNSDVQSVAKPANFAPVQHARYFPLYAKFLRPFDIQ